MNYQFTGRLFLIALLFLVNAPVLALHNDAKKEYTPLIIPRSLIFSAVVGSTAYLMGAKPELRAWILNNPRKIGTALGACGGFGSLLWLHNKLTSMPKPEIAPDLNKIGCGWQDTRLTGDAFPNYDTEGAYPFEYENKITSSSWSFAEKCGLTVFGMGLAGGFAYNIFNKPAIIHALQGKIATSALAQIDYKPYLQVGGAVLGMSACMYGGYRLINKTKKIIADFWQCNQAPESKTLAPILHSSHSYYGYCDNKEVYLQDLLHNFESCFTLQFQPDSIHLATCFNAAKSCWVYFVAAQDKELYIFNGKGEKITSYPFETAIKKVVVNPLFCNIIVLLQNNIIYRINYYIEQEALKTECTHCFMSWATSIDCLSVSRSGKKIYYITDGSIGSLDISERMDQSSRYGPLVKIENNYANIDGEILDSPQGDAAVFAFTKTNCEYALGKLKDNTVSCIDFDKPILTIKPSFNGDYLAVVQEGSIEYINTKTFNIIKSITIENLNKNTLQDVLFLNDTTILLATCKNLIVWDILTGKTTNADLNTENRSITLAYTSQRVLACVINSSGQREVIVLNEWLNTVLERKEAGAIAEVSHNSSYDDPNTPTLIGQVVTNTETEVEKELDDKE